jgi:microcystin-dependent protein
MYGGDGVTTFALPNLQGKVPIHYSNGIQLGQSGGTENHTLTSSEIPWHTHSLSGSSNSPAVQSPASAYLPSNSTALPYASSADSYMSGQTMSSVGGQPHPNMPPYLVMNYVIAIYGLFPSRN